MRFWRVVLIGMILLGIAGNVFAVLALGNARVLGEATILSKDDAAVILLVAVYSASFSIAQLIRVCTERGQRHGSQDT